MTIFRGVDQHIGFIRGAHERLFDLRVIRIGRGITHFSGKSWTAEKHFIGAVASKRELFPPKQGETLISDGSTQEQNVVTSAGQLRAAGT